MRAGSLSFRSQRLRRRLGATTLVGFGISPLFSSVATAQSLLTSDHIRLLIEGRIAERLVVLGAAILSLTFGFFSLNLRPGAKGDLEAGAQHLFWIKLRNVGPGIFFSLFGTALLLWALNTKLDLSLPESSGPIIPKSAQGQVPTDAAVPVTAHVSYGFGIPALAESTQRRRLLAAILTEERIAVPNRPALTKTELAQLQQAVEVLEPIKAAIVDSEAGYAGAYQWWQRLKHDPKYGSPDFEEQLNNKDRSTLRLIEKLQSDALAVNQ